MSTYKNKNLPPEKRAKLLIKEMTLKEKVGQLNQHIYGFDSYQKTENGYELSQVFLNEVKKWDGMGALYGLFRADPWSKRDYSNGICGIDSIKMYNKIQRYVIENSRLSIPTLICEECPHGHQALDSYLLPVNLSLGATWNPKLAEYAFNICGKQMKELGVDFALISVLDVLRDPRWGRSEECCSEDPYLSSKMAGAIIKGLKSAGIESVAKHCCAQGQTTGGNNASAAPIGERELREIHLPTVKTAVESGALGIMAAYNEIDGIPCHGNSWLLNKVLRDEYGFTGFVMADGRAIDRLNTISPNSETNASIALSSGVDLSLWDYSFTRLCEAVEQGLVDETLIDKAVLRILTVKFKLGLFENPYIEEKNPTKYSYSEYTQSLEIARKSPILLKNQSKVLPLKNDIKSLAVIGPFADDIYAQIGDYSPAQRTGDFVTILDGLKGLATEKLTINSMCSPVPRDKEAQNKYIENAVKTASESEIIVAVLGGSSSRFDGLVFGDNGAVISKIENEDCLNLTDCGEGVDVADLSLPKWQTELLSGLKTLGKPIISIINAGRPYAIDEVADKSDALIYSFYSGPMGGKALAELIFGKISPQGRLPVSLPKRSGNVPIFYNYKASYIPKYSDCNATSSFGYGLSYSEFEFNSVHISADECNACELLQNGITISFNIKNIGNMQATAVPQIYIRDDIASTIPRVRMLKGFCTVDLKSGEEKQCEIKLCADDFKLWNKDMRFILEEGSFRIFLYEGDRNRWEGKFNLV